MKEQPSVRLLGQKGFNENVDSVKQYLQNMHSEFDKKFPVATHSSVSEISRLKSFLEQQLKQFHSSQIITSTIQVTWASYKEA